jgi:hypothetical protein
VASRRFVFVKPAFWRVQGAMIDTTYWSADARHVGRPGDSMISSSKLVEIAALRAAAAGDSSPRLIKHGGPISRRAATTVMGIGDVVDNDTPSFVVAMQGDFTVQVRLPWGSQGRGAVGAATRSYRVMTLVVHARTGRVMDVGFAHVMPDISTAGPVGPSCGDSRVSSQNLTPEEGTAGVCCARSLRHPDELVVERARTGR